MRNGLLNRVYVPVPDMFKKNHREIKDAKKTMLYEVSKSFGLFALFEYHNLRENFEYTNGSIVCMSSIVCV